MASVFDNYVYGGHGVAESTLLAASFSGAHFYNLKNDTENIDNGSVAAVPTAANYVESDYFKAIAPKKGDKVVLILTPVKIYEEYTKKMQEEDNFYNAKGEIMRAIEIQETDRFSLSADAFASDAVLAVGNVVLVDENKFKLTAKAAATATTGYGFIGKIIAINPNGTYQIFVEQNKAV